MSTSSGLPGVCPICTHFYNEHSLWRCPAWDKKKQCKKEWYLCQSPDHGYTFCHTCPSHPAAKPSDHRVASNAEEFKHPCEWDGEEERYYYVDKKGVERWHDTNDRRKPKKAKNKEKAHARYDSRDEIDPLQMNPEQIKDIAGPSSTANQQWEAAEALSVGFGQLSIGKSVTQQVEVEVEWHKDKLRFSYGGEKYDTLHKEWNEQLCEDGSVVYWFGDFYTYNLPDKKGKKKQRSK
ncbi:hypothetical protein B0I35DRAFT_447205 [Stachybotrys elegans]|uniref:Uncharacterized protein n=1 Tax=Stachybotrys elegans TaxID=80388 RepID=A0A8K0SFD1_9HYPO|nr:hypothetical protein B0I35DRAFT_447205 [Stachybotrys elegans]